MNHSGEIDHTLALEARKSNLQSALMPLSHDSDQTSGATSLPKEWVGTLLANINEDIARSALHGHKTALLLQFTDGALGHPPDATFAKKYFKALGVKANIGGETREIVPADLKRIITDPTINKVPKPPGEYDNLPEGTITLTYEGINSALVLDTKIEGVRLMLDGSAISTPNRGMVTIRPMMLIKIGDAKVDTSNYEKKVNTRKTWLEIHGREPGAWAKSDYYKRQMQEAAIKSDGVGFDVAEIGYLWQAYPKSGAEIKVTPTELKNNPVLPTEKLRAEAVEEAYRIALQHLYSSAEHSARPVVGATTKTLVNIVETLGMVPSEIAKDSEALADLLEYLKQIAKSTKGVYGPSKLLPTEPIEGDPIMELVYEIEGTYNLPQQEGFRYLTDERVTYQKRQPSSANN